MAVLRNRVGRLVLVDESQIPALLAQGFVVEPPAPDAPPPLEPDKTASEVVVERVGTSAFYDLRRDGVVLERVKGKAAAEARAQSLS